jgi:hypothetical protein
MTIAEKLREALVFLAGAFDLPGQPTVRGHGRALPPARA